MSILSEGAVLPGRRAWMRCAAATALAGLGACASRPPVGPGGGAEIAPFSTAAPGAALPERWHEQVMRRDLPITRYRIARKDGRTVAHAVAERATSGLRCDVDIDPLSTPWLEWDWRVDHIAPGFTVGGEAVDDSPARVALGFDGDLSRLSLREFVFQEQVELFTGHTLPFATLMYVWDGRAPPGSVLRYQRSSRIRYLVVESGEAGTGRWLRYRRNVLDDYRHVFGEAPGRVRSVGVLTDSDDLGARAEAWFGDLSMRGG